MPGWIMAIPTSELSRRLATLLGLAVSCDDQECSSPPPREIDIGGMTISLGGHERSEDSAEAGDAASVLAAGHECRDQFSFEPSAAL